MEPVESPLIREAAALVIGSYAALTLAAGPTFSRGLSLQCLSITIGELLQLP